MERNKEYERFQRLVKKGKYNEALEISDENPLYIETLDRQELIEIIRYYQAGMEVVAKVARDMEDFSREMRSGGLEKETAEADSEVCQ